MRNFTKTKVSYILSYQQNSKVSTKIALLNTKIKEAKNNGEKKGTFSLVILIESIKFETYK